MPAPSPGDRAAPAFGITAAIEAFPLHRPFVISRGSRTEARVVSVAIRDGAAVGRGECLPYPRYGDTPESVLQEIAAAAPGFAGRESLSDLRSAAARNALDCALWDLEAKRSGIRVWQAAGLAAPRPLVTCCTISLGTADAMAEAARAVPEMRLLKLKLGAPGDAERMTAVRAARPDARLMVDANEGWRAEDLAGLIEAAAGCGVELVEQPLPADGDAALAGKQRRVPICADESAHDTAGLAALADRYDAVNIKLDKAGGLTPALAMAAEARRLGLRVMVGCMLATSLSMAPALLVAQGADWVDLDAPLLLARDRSPAMTVSGGMIGPAAPELWG